MTCSCDCDKIHKSEKKNVLSGSFGTTKRGSNLKPCSWIITTSEASNGSIISISFPLKNDFKLRHPVVRFAGTLTDSKAAQAPSGIEGGGQVLPHIPASEGVTSNQRHDQLSTHSHWAMIIPPRARSALPTRLLLGTAFLFRAGLGLTSGFEPPDLDRPGRQLHQQGLIEARLGHRDRQATPDRNPDPTRAERYAWVVRV